MFFLITELQLANEDRMIEYQFKKSFSKTVSSASGIGKAGQPHVNNEVRTHPHTIHKNKLKMA